MKKNLFFVAIILVLLSGASHPVSADNGNNTCPDSAKDGHFCAQSPGKVIIDSESGEAITGVMAKEWSMPSCSYLNAYQKASEHNKDGWNLLFTENCTKQPTPAPTEEQTQPTAEPTEEQTEEQTQPSGTATIGIGTAIETMAGCPDPECICIELGPDTQDFLTNLFERFFDLIEKSFERFFALADKSLDIWAKK